MFKETTNDLVLYFNHMPPAQASRDFIYQQYHIVTQDQSLCL